MSATAFQRARREAAAIMRAASETVQEEQELNINETKDENEGSMNERTLQEESLREENANENEPDSDANEVNEKEESTQKKDYTVGDLKKMCDEKGIEYKSRATKVELTELLGM